MEKICVIIANGSDDIETIVPISLWRKAGFVVDLISVENKNTLILDSGIKISCSYSIDKINISKYNAIYLPGGSGIDKLKKEKLLLKHSENILKVHNEIKKFISEDKLIFGMSTAPIIFNELGLLNDVKFTGLPSLAEEFKDLNFADESVVVDKNFVTAKSSASIVEFTYKIIEMMLGNEALDNLKKQINDIS